MGAKSAPLCQIEHGLLRARSAIEVGLAARLPAQCVIREGVALFLMLAVMPPPRYKARN
jgi:hypothetical protein